METKKVTMLVLAGVVVGLVGGLVIGNIGGHASRNLCSINEDEYVHVSDATCYDAYLNTNNDKIAYGNHFIDFKGITSKQITFSYCTKTSTGWNGPIVGFLALKDTYSKQFHLGMTYIDYDSAATSDHYYTAHVRICPA